MVEIGCIYCRRIFYIPIISFGRWAGSGDFDGSAYFQLTAFFPDGTAENVGTTAAFGPCRIITGHSGDRPIQLAMQSEMRPTRLQLKLVSDGIGQVAFSNLSIVQFESPATGAAAGVPPHSWPWTVQRFIRGAGWSAVVASVLLAIVVVLAPRFTLARNAGPMVMLGVGEGLFAWAMFLIGRREALDHLEPLFAGALAWVLPFLARRLVFRRLHEQELRKMLTRIIHSRLAPPAGLVSCRGRTTSEAFLVACARTAPLPPW